MSDKYTFPKQARLLKKVQFQDTLAKEQSLLGKYYVCYYHPNGLTYPRLGIITAKKKCHLAVLRNRIKRQVREVFRHHQSKLPSCDMVILARNQRKRLAKRVKAMLRQLALKAYQRIHWLVG